MCRQGKANFGDAGVFLEKYVQRARHIEVQMFGDGEGNMVTFVERECSIQRRHQKIVEETPSPYVGGLPALLFLGLPSALFIGLPSAPSLGLPPALGLSTLQGLATGASYSCSLVADA